MHILGQKQSQTRHDWVGKVIKWELCKEFKSDHTNKLCILKLTSVPENETQTLMGV